MAASTDLPVLVGIDVGTASVRAIAFDMSGTKIAAAARPTPVVATDAGDEYDPDSVFRTVVAVLAEIGRALGQRPVAGMAVASVGESCVLVDRQGNALAPAIAWYDRRSEPHALALAGRIDPARVFAITGNAIDPTFTLCKLSWMRDHWPVAVSRAHRLLMMADWVAFRLSGEAATDPTLASRTLYFDIHRRQWSPELLSLVGLDPRLPAKLMASGTALGRVRPDVLAETAIAGKPVVAVGGHDHLVGSFAAGLVAPRTVLDSLGTAEAILLATAAPLDHPEVVRRGYYQGAIETHRRMSYLGGGLYPSGGAVEWFRSIAGKPSHAELIAEAEGVPAGSDGIVFLPHLANSPPPQPDPKGRGAFVGLTAGATRGALYRAVLEGLAMQARLMVDGMTGFPGIGRPQEFRVIGGGTRNRLFLSIKASVFAAPLTVIEEAEATALGAAMLGGIGAGVHRDLDEALARLRRDERIIAPDSSVERYEKLRTMMFQPLAAALQPINRAQPRT